MKFLDISGKRIGNWLVLWVAGRQGSQGVLMYACQCKCGRVKAVAGYALRRGKTSKCRSCTNAQVKVKHGHCRCGIRPEYRAYYAAKDRCNNPKNDSYQDYGGRGIKFKFKSFEQWFAELGSRPANRSVDRINNDGHYEPGNVRWATNRQQRRNQRIAA